MGSFLVTGGAGFIGSHLVGTLLERGDSVTVLDDLSTGRLENINPYLNHPEFRFVPGSVRDAYQVDELAHACEVIVHLAAAVGVQRILDQPLRSFTTNIRGSENVLEAAYRHRRRILIASTSEIYGKNSAVPLREEADRVLGSPAVARWSYSTAKAVDEILAYFYHRERGLPSTVVRLFNTVGPRQSAAYGMVIPRLVRQAVSGQPLTVYGTGRQTRCFCHVTDVVRGLLLLLDEPASIGEVFNLGTTEEIAMLDLAGRVRDLTGSVSPIELISYEQAYPQPGFEDMERRVPDTSKIRRLVGWEPTCTLDDILKESVVEAESEQAEHRDQRF